MSKESPETIFEDVARMTVPPDVDPDPYQTMEYQRFVESMVPHCRCRSQDCPCDGVLAGGLCDDIQDESDWLQDDE